MLKANELKSEVARNEMTLEELARFLGINTSTLNRKMYGKSDFYRNEIVQIANILHLSQERINAIFFA